MATQETGRAEHINTVLYGKAGTAMPAFGIVSLIVPTFARKRLFGYRSMVYATASIAILSFVVWAHHMFTVGLPLPAQLFFMYATILIAVPTGVKVFNWVATLFRGSISFELPMLFALAFIVQFTVGGLYGVMLADRGRDLTAVCGRHVGSIVLAGNAGTECPPDLGESAGLPRQW